MRLMWFLKDKVWFIFSQIVLVIFLAVVLSTLKASVYLNLLICGTVLAISSFSIFIEYYSRKSYYDNILKTLNSMDKKQYLYPLIPKASFSDGKILKEIVGETSKAMNDEIAYYKIMNEEYREYIETWIHEVKVPISGISLLCNNNRNDVTKSIGEENRKIEYYVEQALFYARSTNVEKDYSIQSVNLDTLVKSAAKKYSKEIIAVRGQMDFKDLHEQVYTDSKWLQFIVGQIICNSIKYKKDNLLISFSSEEFQGGIKLIIKDNGIGIPKEDLPRIFDKGFTGENGRRFSKSTGMGLYLCNQLCEKMGLSIKVASEVEKGTTITISFPKDKFILLS